MDESLQPQPTTERPSPGRAVAGAFDALFAPIAIFLLFYFGTMFAAARWLPSFYVSSLVSAIVATAAAVALWDRGRWRLGVVAPPLVAIRESAAGLAFAAILIGTGDLLVLATTGMRHSPGTGFPFAETLAVYLPAAVYEELIFRGYPFQRFWRWRGGVALIFFPALFAWMHSWNAGVTPLALVNIFLGGILLSLAYAIGERLWFPTGLHLGWNLMSGPVLGYEISGYRPEASVLRVSGGGPEILTGGAFGIEGSICMTVVEAVAIVLMAKRWRMKNFE